MLDPTSFIPERLKEKVTDALVELLAGSAERLGGDQIAGKIRTFSSRGHLLQSIDRALEAGIQHFIEEYTGQDEDLVDAIQGDELFWQSEVVQDALVKLVSQPGAWLREERETVAYHFETILPKRVNRERVDKAVNFLLRCIAEELWSLPGAQEIRAAYSIQFQELTAEAQREQVALARQQLRATAQMSADLQQALLQLIGLVEQKVLAVPVPVAMLVSPRPYHNLPQPTYKQFVGRDEELAWLRQRLSPADRAWQIAITGIGGVGKSALALAIAHEYRQRYNELPPEECFEAIVWVSAKEEVLTAFGRERAAVPEQVLHTLEDVYTVIARVLEHEDITRAQPHEQNALVEIALKCQRTLLIMDNLESVKDDRIKAFLRNLPSPTKVIITSRESLDVADVKPLTGLPWEKAEVLIEEDCRVREVSLTPFQRRRIFELTSGLPLLMKLGVARLAGGESFALLDRWMGDAVGELPEYSVKGQIDLVRERDPNAWTVLLACALFGREAGALREALGEVADISLADRDKALAQLQRFFLVNRTDSDRFWVLPIVGRYVGAELGRDASLQWIIDRWLDWLVTFANNAQDLQPSSRDLEVIQTVGREYANLRVAIDWCREREMWDSLLTLCEGTWPYAYLVGLFSDLEDILEVWLAAALQTGTEHAEGRAYLQFGRLKWIQRGTREEAAHETSEYLDKAELILEKFDDRSQLVEVWATRAQILIGYDELDEAEGLARRILDAGERLDDLVIMGMGARHLGIIENLRGEYDKAHEWLNQAEKWARQLGSPRNIAAALHLRAGVSIAQNHWGEAEMSLNEALEIGLELREHRLVASCKRQLAEVYLATRRLRMAQQLAEDVRNTGEQLGVKTLQGEAAEILRRLQVAA